MDCDRFFGFAKENESFFLDPPCFNIKQRLIT